MVSAGGGAKHGQPASVKADHNLLLAAPSRQINSRLGCILMQIISKFYLPTSWSWSTESAEARMDIFSLCLIIGQVVLGFLSANEHFVTKEKKDLYNALPFFRCDLLK